MSSHTMLGVALWSWEPWTKLPDDTARMFWLGLYTTPEAKRIVPGLWHGSIISMAEACRLSTERAARALDDLLEAELVEFDTKTRVLRLTQLPDHGEAASNVSWIRGWWNRFRTVPQCQIRDAHVRTLWWLIEERARVTGSTIPTSCQSAWAETFGTIPLPAIRHRGVRRLAEDDLSTPSQPSLFSAASSVASANSVVSGISASDLPSEGNQTPDTLSTGCGTPCLRSEICTLDLLPEAEGSVRGGHESRMPRLEVVPGYTPDQLIAALGFFRPGRASIPEALRPALGALIRDLEHRGWGVEHARSGGKWLASRATSELDLPNVPPDQRIATWAVVPGNVVRAITNAQRADQEASDRSAILRELARDA